MVLDAVHRLELGLLPTSARGEPMGIVERGVWRQAGLQPMPWSGVELKNERVVTVLGLEEDEVVLRAVPGWYARVRRGPDRQRLSVFGWVAKDGLLVNSLWRAVGASEAHRIGWQLRPLRAPAWSGELMGYFHKRTWPERPPRD